MYKIVFGTFDRKREQVLFKDGKRVLRQFTPVSERLYTTNEAIEELRSLMDKPRGAGTKEVFLSGMLSTDTKTKTFFLDEISGYRVYKVD